VELSGIDQFLVLSSEAASETGARANTVQEVAKGRCWSSVWQSATSYPAARKFHRPKFAKWSI